MVNSVPLPLRKLSKAHSDYWSRRLRQRTYKYGGKTCVIPLWQARVKSQKRDFWFNTNTPNKAAAAEKARDFWIFLKANGWEATLAKFVPKNEAKPDISEKLALASFCKLCQELRIQLQCPPRATTTAYYLLCLRSVCRKVKVNSIEKLTPEKVEEFKGLYRAEGRKAGRDESALEISLASTLRNAAAVFTEEMLGVLARQGLSLENVFKGRIGGSSVIPAYQPMRAELMDAIWRDAKLLRDGDPSSKPVPKKRKRKRGERTEPDFRKPQLASYAILLLELGCGLRRKEADLAEWDWLGTDDAGRHSIHIKATAHFTPKNRQSRYVPVEPMIYKELVELRAHYVSPFIVPGPLLRAGEQRKRDHYRCDAAHAVLIKWLRLHGVTDQKPCHALRKEFGSHVATSHSLFAAQRLLGHSSPVVTDKYYAGLVQLPEIKIAKFIR